MAEITVEESKKIEELKGRVSELLKTEYSKSDTNLIRWLRARDLKVDAAEKMLREHYKWREENRVDSLLAESPDPYFHKNFPHWLNGVDTKGRPVLCIPMGDWDVRKVVEDDRVKEFADFINRMYERVMECIENCNARRRPDQEPVTQFTCLVNWDRFTGKQTASITAMQAMLNCARVYEAHYPEIMGQAFFVNTNPFFQLFFNMMKPILAPRTLSKIVCYGTNRNEWEPIVRAVVEEHQIPRQFGG